LLKSLELTFEVLTKYVEEDFPAHFRREDTAMFLARKKALAFKENVANGGIVITADTIVAVDDLILGKPTDAKDAERMLKLISGRKHQVITGVCIMSSKKSESFFVKTDVSFKLLKDDEIKFYIDKYNPLDKAGAYGIQEWIGMIGVEYIQGSYYNVMGLPTKELYDNLMRF
jgi:septum formation protein